jgi:transaldolase/glucose-6-phosphate isomerase
VKDENIMSDLKSLLNLGQAVWLDSISRELIDSGELKRLMNSGLRGLTSNPAIFEKAMGQSDDYARGMTEAAREGLDAGAIFERLAVADIRDAADVLREVYDATQGADGFVSLEVSPLLANDTAGTMAEARRLWDEVKRPNLMIKVPGTEAGAPAVRTLISEGININITLLFARAAYEKVAEAWLQGLEARASKGEDISRVASVASFFVSRIDTAVDTLIDKSLPQGGNAELGELRGKIAIANAKLAYRFYQQLIGGERWKKLAAKGARPQRLLWASTSTKNPAYRDVIYVEGLIGADTVNTLPPATLEAFVDHGTARNTLTEGVGEAERHLATLARNGIALAAVTDRLLDDGIKQFAQAFDKLLAAVESRTKALKSAAA